MTFRVCDLKRVLLLQRQEIFLVDVASLQESLPRHSQRVDLPEILQQREKLSEEGALSAKDKEMRGVSLQTEEGAEVTDNVTGHRSSLPTCSKCRQISVKNTLPTAPDLRDQPLPHPLGLLRDLLLHWRHSDLKILRSDLELLRGSQQSIDDGAPMNPRRTALSSCLLSLLALLWWVLGLEFGGIHGRINFMKEALVASLYKEVFLLFQTLKLLKGAERTER
jgi:hypothetical protein